ncbi:sulfotransferase [Brevibacillus sp. SYSU BS000544]|uniref:sulfotransferase n=1 Tax=Brevibacillus sp. SYSU BS000544 TaxID=3416443 RepID=UPI003CE48A61
MDVILSAATHRSGSTLLQRIFNARKETLVWGEHLGVLRDFVHIQQKVMRMSRMGQKSRESYFNQGENPNQWLAIMAPGPYFIRAATIQSVKMYLDCLYSQHREGHDMVGFKEVRYGAQELSILQECYPQAKLVLIVRNPIEAWKSYPKSWGEYRSALQFARQWNRNVNYYLQLVNSNPNASLIQYEKMVRKDPVTIERLAQLAQLTHQEIHSVLAQKIRGSRRKKTITMAQRAIIRRHCRRNMRLLGYL